MVHNNTYTAWRLFIKTVLSSTFIRQSLRSSRAGSESGNSTKISNNSSILQINNTKANGWPGYTILCTYTPKFSKCLISTVFNLRQPQCFNTVGIFSYNNDMKIIPYRLYSRGVRRGGWGSRGFPRTPLLTVHILFCIITYFPSVASRTRPLCLPGSDSAHKTLVLGLGHAPSIQNGRGLTKGAWSIKFAHALHAW